MIFDKNTKTKAEIQQKIPKRRLKFHIIPKRRLKCHRNTTTEAEIQQNTKAKAEILQKIPEQRLKFDKNTKTKVDPDESW